MPGPVATESGEGLATGVDWLLEEDPPGRKERAALMDRRPRRTSRTMTAGRALPDTLYLGEADRLLKPFRSHVTNLLETATTLLRHMGLSVTRAKIWKFTSREDPHYFEYVLTLYSDDDPVTLIDCADQVSEFVGDWRRRQPDGVREQFADRVTVELLPAELDQRV